MVPIPWYIGNIAPDTRESSDQLHLPIGLENTNRISKKNKIGMSESQQSNPLQNVSVKHIQTLLDLVKRSSVSNCHANGECRRSPHFVIFGSKE